MISLEERILKLTERQEDMLGNATAGVAVTATLRVSPDGDNSDGLTLRTAYQTINAALDAASLDANAMTLILIAPHATYYDINTTGDPTWAANVILLGSVSDEFVNIRNTHASATHILTLTGKSAVINLTFTQTGSIDGINMTHAGAIVRHIRFNGTAMTGAGTSLHFDGASVQHGLIENCEFQGHVNYTTGLLIDQWGFCTLTNLHFEECLIAIHIVGADADENDYKHLDIGDCALGIDIDAGNNQHFTDIGFHDNTRNIDDEVGDHAWVAIHGRFDIEILPDDVTGINVSTGAAGVYGADTELLPAAGRDNPFRVVGYAFDQSTTELYNVRFSDDSGATFFDVVPFFGSKQSGSSAPSGTEHIFNKGTRVSASARDVSGGDNVDVWLLIQEI